MFKTQYHSGEPMRIDKFLTHFLVDVSRQYVQELIIHQVVFKNGIVVKKPKEMVSLGDIIEVDIGAAKQYTINSIALDIKKELRDKVKIICEHKDFLVIDKPAGLLVHKTNNPHSYSLVDIMKDIYPEIEGVKDKNQSPEAQMQQRDGVVHRIDKDTSGLVLMARNQESFEIFKDLFKQRKVYKEYICLVRGHVKIQHNHITYPIIRSKLDHTKRVAVVSNKQSKIQERHADTEYWVQEKYNKASLIRVVIHTGRTHQIRIHMKAIGHPIIGDKLYGGKAESQDNNSLSRQFLHATRLQFDYKEEKYTFDSQLPRELQNYIETIE